MVCDRFFTNSMDAIFNIIHILSGICRQKQQQKKKIWRMLTGKIFSCVLGGGGGGRGGGRGDRKHYIPVIHLDTEAGRTFLKFHGREKKRADEML